MKARQRSVSAAAAREDIPKLPGRVHRNEVKAVSESGGPIYCPKATANAEIHRSWWPFTIASSVFALRFYGAKLPFD